MAMPALQVCSGSSLTNCFGLLLAGTREANAFYVVFQKVSGLGLTFRV